MSRALQLGLLFIISVAGLSAQTTARKPAGQSTPAAKPAAKPSAAASSPEFEKLLEAATSARQAERWE